MQYGLKDYLLPDLLFPLLPKLVDEGFIFLVDPVFLPFELLERSRKSLDFGFGFDERDGFLAGLAVEKFEELRVPDSVFRVPRSVFRVTGSVFLLLTSCSLPLTSCLLPLFMDPSSVEVECSMADMISLISFGSS